MKLTILFLIWLSNFLTGTGENQLAHLVRLLKLPDGHGCRHWLRRGHRLWHWVHGGISFSSGSAVGSDIETVVGIGSVEIIGDIMKDDIMKVSPRMR